MPQVSDKTSGRKLALITGASTGIGYEFAKVLIEKNYDILVVAEEAEIVESAQALRQNGAMVQPIRANLATREGVEKVFESFRKLDRPLDLLMLNAGVGVHGDFTRDNSFEEQLNLLNLNIVSVVHLAKLILPEMANRGKGHVLITSSIAALLPGPLFATYAASKAFLLSFAEALHNELQDRGVVVTALMPGPTETEFFVRAHMEHTKVANQEKDDPAQVAREAYEALMDGKDRFIAGSVKNKIQGFFSRFLTDQQKASMHKDMNKPKNSEAPRAR